MRVAIVGAGYVGLVTGACLAEKGHAAVCVDKDREKVRSILGYRAPFHEPGLDSLLVRHVGKGLEATTDVAAAVASSDVTLIAVGTPLRDNRIDLSHVIAATREVGSALRAMDRTHAVIVKSTVVPGTTDGPVREALEVASGKRVGDNVGLGMNPEFLTEGQAVADFLNPDRIVLGAADSQSRDALRELYAGFNASAVLETNNPTAEMIKYASNALLAAMISFSNEVARLSSATGGVDAVDVMRGVHLSSYLTTRTDDGNVQASITSFLHPGCGYGGSCLPKDVAALVAHGAEQGLDLPLLRAVMRVNREQPAEVLRLLLKRLPDLRGRRVVVLGLTFKPDTDDMRESPAFPVIRLLAESGAVVEAYDPLIARSDDPRLSGVRLHADLDTAVAEAEAVVLVTKWPEFKQLGALLRSTGATPVVVDGRRFLNPPDFAMYEGIGR